MAQIFNPHMHVHCPGQLLAVTIAVTLAHSHIGRTGYGTSAAVEKTKLRLDYTALLLVVAQPSQQIILVCANIKSQCLQRVPMDMQV